MRYIIGLGNPGLKYRLTKHNIGVNIVRKLAKENRITMSKKWELSLVGEGSIAGRDVTLVLPQTYMNLSGEAVEELFRTKIGKIEDMIVVCDDINLKLGRIRVKKNGSAGGHKGLASIIKSLGRDDFARLRFGIATDVHKGDITGYVLSPFKKNELKNVSHAVDFAVQALTAWVEKDTDFAMTHFNKSKLAAS